MRSPGLVMPLAPQPGPGTTQGGERGKELNSHVMYTRDSPHGGTLEAPWEGLEQVTP